MCAYLRSPPANQLSLSRGPCSSSSLSLSRTIGGRLAGVSFHSPMRPIRGAVGLPHVDGGGSEAGPPPSVFPRPLPDMCVQVGCKQRVDYYISKEGLILTMSVST